MHSEGTILHLDLSIIIKTNVYVTVGSHTLHPGCCNQVWEEYETTKHKSSPVITRELREDGKGDISSCVLNSSSPYLTFEMEPSALKGLASKINILPHLTKEATAEQHEIKEHISLNRGSGWHLREATSSGGDTCLSRWLLPIESEVSYRRVLQSIGVCWFLFSAGKNPPLVKWFRLQDVLLQTVSLGLIVTAPPIPLFSLCRSKQQGVWNFRQSQCLVFLYGMIMC